MPIFSLKLASYPYTDEYILPFLHQDSILDIKSVLPFTATEKSMRIVSYMDNFPFPYYVIVRDLNQLPVVLSEGLRQWFELVNSEQ